MRKEALGFTGFVLVILSVFLAFKHLWGLFAVSFIITLTFYYVQEYKKMYDKKDIDISNSPHNEDYFSFGPWVLGYDLDNAYKRNQELAIYGKRLPLRKFITPLQGKDLAEFKSAGARSEFSDEKFYESENFDHLGLKDWTSMVSTHRGRIFKIALTFVLHSSDSGDYANTLVAISNDLQKRFGNSHVRPSDKNQFIYDAPELRIRLTVRKHPIGATQFNVIARLK